MSTLKEMFNRDQFENALGARVVEVREKYAKVEMMVEVRHLNIGGVCHGGVIFSLADLAFGVVVNSCGKLTLSLNANITFLRPARIGMLYAEACEVMGHGKVPFVEVKVFDANGEQIAYMTSTGYRKHNDLIVDSLM